jgi:biopolymer transport protein ExbD
MEFEGRKKITTQLNIAPLIDIVFLLLIFFMLSSHFITQPGIKITLPMAVTARLHSDEDVVVYIGSDSRLYLNTEEVMLDDLLERLKAKINDAPNKNVIIKADEKVDLGVAVTVMDIARQAKAEGLVISTEVKENVKR